MQDPTRHHDTATIGAPIGLMKKARKIEVVRELERRGFFTIRKAADLAAQRLEVSRITIYNYLNELQAKSGDAQQRRTASPRSQ